MQEILYGEVFARLKFSLDRNVRVSKRELTPEMQAIIYTVQKCLTFFVTLHHL